MSTQFYTQDQPATSQPATGQPDTGQPDTGQQDTGRRAARPRRGGPSWPGIAAIIIGAVAAAALIVLAASGLTRSHPAPAPAPPAVPPSAAVKTLQQQLGQLNYYEGPVDGIMGPQTIAAIKDLQRQAGLPQTGTMNPATQAALASYLAHGNNQMAG